MLVLHHGDFDGVCAASIIKTINNSCKCVEYNYNQEFPMSIINNNETVFLVDLTLSQELMEELNNRSQLIWIDHHLAINDIDIKPFRKYCKIGTAACKLVYQYFYKNKFNQVVEYINNYDIWNHEDPNTIYFHYGILLENDLSPNNTKLWKKLLSDNFDCSEYINNGKIIYKYIKNTNKEKIKNNAFLTKFCGYKTICINDNMANSKIFDSCIGKYDYELMIIFKLMKNKKWIISLYTEKDYINCAEIAKKFQGGGHKAAAGFCSNTLPKELLN